MRRRRAILALAVFSLATLAEGCRGGDPAEPIADEEVVSAQTVSLRIEGMT